MMAAKDAWSKSYSFFVGKGPAAKEALDFLITLKDNLKFTTHVKFIEWIVNFINSPQNEESRKFTTASNSNKTTVSRPTNLPRSNSVVIVKKKSVEDVIVPPSPALAGLFTPPLLHLHIIIIIIPIPPVRLVF